MFLGQLIFVIRVIQELLTDLFWWHFYGGDGHSTRRKY